MGSEEGVLGSLLPAGHTHCLCRSPWLPPAEVRGDAGRLEPLGEACILNKFADVAWKSLLHLERLKWKGKTSGLGSNQGLNSPRVLSTLIR